MGRGFLAALRRAAFAFGAAYVALEVVVGRGPFAAPTPHLRWGRLPPAYVAAAWAATETSQAPYFHFDPSPAFALDFLGHRACKDNFVASVAFVGPRASYTAVAGVVDGAVGWHAQNAGELAEAVAAAEGAFPGKNHALAGDCADASQARYLVPSSLPFAE